MKKSLLVAIALLLVLTGAFIDRYILRFQRADAEESTARWNQSPSVENVLRPSLTASGESRMLVAQAAQKTAAKADTWVAKIDNTTITLDDFEREFNVHIFSLPLDEGQKKKYIDDPINKKNFLKSLINELLVYRKAAAEGFDKRKDIQDLLKSVTRRAIVQVYLSEKLEPKLNEPSDEQIEAIYNQNKKLFANMDIDQARQQIKLQLLQRQYNDLLDDLIEKLKGESKVVRNEDVKL